MKRKNKIVEIKAKQLKGTMNTYYMCPKCKAIVPLNNFCGNCGEPLQ